MISATVYALVIVPIAVVSLGLLALVWASASAARIDRARAELAAAGFGATDQRMTSTGLPATAARSDAGENAPSPQTGKTSANSMESEKTKVDA